jgi:hypothetical protein
MSGLGAGVEVDGALGARRRRQDDNKTSGRKRGAPEMQRVRRFGVLGFGAALAAVAAAGAAWACVPVATLNVSPAQVKPGEEVALTGNFYNNKNPVLIRFNALDGPVLTTITPTDSAGQPGTDDSRLINAKVTIPADVRPGNYVLVATQEPVLGRNTWGVPSRALVTVVGDGGAPVVAAPLTPIEDSRPAGLERGGSVGAGALVLVALGVAGVAMFLAGTAAMFAGRRREVPEVARSGR